MIALVFLIAVNALAFRQAWTMTHYAADGTRTRPSEKLNLGEKMSAVLFGPSMVRMKNVYTPRRYDLDYSTVTFPGYAGLQLESWRIAGEPGHPVVLLFHGYCASKDTLLRAANEFHALGCETWLTDLHGSGGSAGNTTSIGYHEAEDVAATVREAIRAQPASRPLVLYGTSMGAAAILCAVDRKLVQPDALVLECPFDRLTTTIGNRFSSMGIPAFPAAGLVVFWCSLQEGFNGFAHNPVRYAGSVRCPTLLMQGERDENVGLEHGRAIAAALGDHGAFKVFPGLGHAFLVYDGAAEWRYAVRNFMDANLR